MSAEYFKPPDLAAPFTLTDLPNGDTVLCGPQFTPSYIVIGATTEIASATRTRSLAQAMCDAANRWWKLNRQSTPAEWKAPDAAREVQ